MADLQPPVVDPWLGEIRMFCASTISINVGWHLCDGALLKISAYQELYSLIGTTFGGDGVTNFALPDLRGRLPLHQGNNIALGKMDGQETVALTQDQLPAHTHTVNSSKSDPQESPKGNFWGISSSNPYASPPGHLTLNPASVSDYGFGYAHENRIPYMVVNFIIALKGTYPTPG